MASGVKLIAKINANSTKIVTVELICVCVCVKVCRIVRSP